MSGLIVTMLDGPDKSGIVVALARPMALPLRFLVVGESPAMNALLITRNGGGRQQSILFETDIPALENIAEEPVFFF